MGYNTFDFAYNRFSLFGHSSSISSPYVGLKIFSLCARSSRARALQNIYSLQDLVLQTHFMFNQVVLRNLLDDVELYHHSPERKKELQERYPY